MTEHTARPGRPGDGTWDVPPAGSEGRAGGTAGRARGWGGLSRADDVSARRERITCPKGWRRCGKNSATVHFQREYHRPNNAAIVQAGLGSQPTRLEIVRRFSAPPSSRLTPLT